MKPTLILSTTLSFLLFALTTHFPLSFAQYPVEDTDGHPLVPGDKYYILPTITGPKLGGGLKLNKTSLQNCPLTVNQDYSENFLGFPVKFNVKNGEDNIYQDYTSVDIEFDTNPECAHSSKWVLAESFSFRSPWIGIGSIEDLKASNAKVIDGEFYINEISSGYKLVFYSAPVSGGFRDILTYPDVTGSRLVIYPRRRPKPEQDFYRNFEVKFVKASGNGRSVI